MDRRRARPNAMHVHQARGRGAHDTEVRRAVRRAPCRADASNCCGSECTASPTAMLDGKSAEHEVWVSGRHEGRKPRRHQRSSCGLVVFVVVTLTWVLARADAHVDTVCSSRPDMLARVWLHVRAQVVSARRNRRMRADGQHGEDRPQRGAAGIRSQSGRSCRSNTACGARHQRMRRKPSIYARSPVP